MGLKMSLFMCLEMVKVEEVSLTIQAVERSVSHFSKRNVQKVW